MKKRKIYCLILVIVILIFEFIEVFLGIGNRNKTKIKPEKIQTTEINEEIVNEIIEENEEIPEEKNLEIVQEITEENMNLSSEMTNIDYIEVVEEQIDTQSYYNTYYDKNFFVDGHLKEYPMFRRRIWNFNYK